MPGTVCNKCNEAFVFAGQVRVQCVECTTDEVNNVNIGPFIVATKTIRFAGSAHSHNDINSTSMILDIQPVADVESFPIHR